MKDFILFLMVIIGVFFWFNVQAQTITGIDSDHVVFTNQVTTNQTYSLEQIDAIVNATQKMATRINNDLLTWQTRQQQAIQAAANARPIGTATGTGTGP